MSRPPADLTVTVSARSDVGDVVVLDLVADPGHELPGWSPGAHIDVLLPDGETVRQYSLCGPIDSDQWRIAILREDAGRGGSWWLHEHARPGTRLDLAGPRNHFAFDQPSEGGTPVLLLAGGIGVTPLVPMAERAARAGLDYTLHLAGHDGRIPFVDELTTLHGDRLVLHVSEREARMDLAALLAAATRGTVVYCCGPARLLDEVEREAARHDLDLRTERFTPDEPSAPVWSAEFEVEFALTGVTATVAPDRSVLEVAEEAGIFVLSSCQEGTCGTCETIVTEGAVDHRDSILTPTERESGNVMYVCVSRAAGPRLVVEL